MKKSEIKIADLFAEIAKKCYIISSNSIAVVFFEYSAQINSYTILVHPNGWKRDVYGDEMAFLEDINTPNLKKTIKKLDKLAKELGIKDYV